MATPYQLSLDQLKSGEFIAMKFFRRRSSSPPSAPHHPVASAGAVPQQCQNCGSTQLLFRDKVLFTATYVIDDERSISRRYKRMQVHCKKCDFMVNDDLYGDAQVVYAQLAEQAGSRTPRVRVAAEVAKVIRAAKRLPALSDAELQPDYDRAREPWGCAGMHTIPESELQDALTRIFRGYFAEGAYEFEIVKTETLEILEPGILMLAFYTATGFRPVRLARNTNGSFVVYGQIQLYRILDAL